MNSLGYVNFANPLFLRRANEALSNALQRLEYKKVSGSFSDKAVSPLQEKNVFQGLTAFQLALMLRQPKLAAEFMLAPGFNLEEQMRCRFEAIKGESERVYEGSLAGFYEISGKNWVGKPANELEENIAQSFLNKAQETFSQAQERPTSERAGFINKRLKPAVLFEKLESNAFFSARDLSIYPDSQERFFSAYVDSTLLGAGKRDLPMVLLLSEADYRHGQEAPMDQKFFYATLMEHMTERLGMSNVQVSLCHEMADRDAEVRTLTAPYDLTSEIEAIARAQAYSEFVEEKKAHRSGMVVERVLQDPLWDEDLAVAHAGKMTIKPSYVPAETSVSSKQAMVDRFEKLAGKHNASAFLKSMGHILSADPEPKSALKNRIAAYEERLESLKAELEQMKEELVEEKSPQHAMP